MAAQVPVGEHREVRRIERRDRPFRLVEKPAVHPGGEAAHLRQGVVVAGIVLEEIEVFAVPGRGEGVRAKRRQAAAPLDVKHLVAPAGHQQRGGRHAGQQHVHLVYARADPVPPQPFRAWRVQVADRVVGHAVQAAARSLAGDAVVEQGREQRGVAAAAHATHGNAPAEVHVGAGGQIIDAAQRVQDEVAVRRVAGQVGAHAVGEVVVAGLLLGILSGRIEQYGQKAQAGERLRGDLIRGVLLARVPDRQHHRGKRPRPVRNEDRGVHLPARERLEQHVLDPAVAGLVPADQPCVHRRPGVAERHGAERRADVVADRLAQLPPSAGGQEPVTLPVAALQTLDGARDQMAGQVGAQVAVGLQRSRDAWCDHVSPCRAAKIVSLVASPICSRPGRRPDRRSESRTSFRKPSPRASM